MNAVAQQERQETMRAKRFVAPRVNVFVDQDAYVLEAEMPGVNKEGLEITLEGNELTIVGHRHEESVNAELLFGECRRADYRRTFELDPTIDTARIHAKMDQGILTLRLPKHEKVKPQKISIE